MSFGRNGISNVTTQLRPLLTGFDSLGGHKSNHTSVSANLHRCLLTEQIVYSPNPPHIPNATICMQAPTPSFLRGL